MATFNTTPNPCPFNWYSADPAFQADADRVVTFVMRRLGEDFLSVELTKKMVYAAFEEATMLLNANIIEYQAKSNLTSLLGTPTGSIDPNTGLPAVGTVNFTDTYIYPSLDWLNRQAEPYLASIGYGQSQDTYSGSINISASRQDYDLYTELIDQNGVPLSEYSFSGSSPMRVVEVYHFAPSNFMFNSNFYGQTGGGGFGVGTVGNYGTNALAAATYQLLPVFGDVLRGHMLQTAMNVRMSTFRYRVSGRTLRIYPAPRIDTKLWIRVMFPLNVAPGALPSGSYTVSGSYYLTPGGFPGQLVGVGGNIYGSAHPANIAAGLISYTGLNPWARSWIFQYTLAICKEMVGQVRTKFKNFPIPGAELELNGDVILRQAKEEMERLLNGENGLISTLDSLTYDKLAEREATKAENMMKQMAFLPIPPTALSWG
mgnify:FL=1